MITAWSPIVPDTAYWDTAVTTYAGTPVVYKGSGNAGMATNPAGSSADHILGVAMTDAGPLALGNAVNATMLAVAEYGRVKMYAKGTVHAGDVVKIGATISVTPPGYASAVTVYTAQTMAQTAAGSQPYPVLGYAESESSADGDYIYVKLVKGMYF